MAEFSEQTALRTQGVLYVVTGVWPFVSRRTFEAVTGPKREWWLVQTVGALVTVIGGVLLRGAARERVPPELTALAAGSASGLAAIDVVYVAKRRIAPTYLLDAAVELALAAWVLAARRRPRTRAGDPDRRRAASTPISDKGRDRPGPHTRRRLVRPYAGARTPSGGQGRSAGQRPTVDEEHDMPEDDDRLRDLEARRREERRAVEEAGGGVSEGFELAEEDLIDHASHGDEISASRILRDAGTLDEEQSGAVYGEADEEGHPD